MKRGRKPGTPSPSKGKKYKPESTTISVRMPVALLQTLKEIAAHSGITWNRFAVSALTSALLEHHCEKCAVLAAAWHQPVDVELS